MTTDPPLRRKWHLTRWLLVGIIATLGWGGWRAYTFRSALAQARALGWSGEYTYPARTIQKNWKAAFEKDTWLVGVTLVWIPTSEAFERNLAMIHRLNPKRIRIDSAATLRDLSALQPLPRLRSVRLDGCTGLTDVDGLKSLSALQSLRLSGCTGLRNVDGLKNLSALQSVRLDGCTELTRVDALGNLPALQELILNDCTGLTNLDALKNLPALRIVWLTGCRGLTPESVAALNAALPNAEIIGP